MAWEFVLLLGLVGENYRGYYSGKGKSGGGKFIGGNMGSKKKADEYSDLRKAAAGGDTDAQKKMEAMRDKANAERVSAKASGGTGDYKSSLINDESPRGKIKAINKARELFNKELQERVDATVDKMFEQAWGKENKGTELEWDIKKRKMINEKDQWKKSQDISGLAQHFNRNMFITSDKYHDTAAKFEKWHEKQPHILNFSKRDLRDTGSNLDSVWSSAVGYLQQNL